MNLIHYQMGTLFEMGNLEIKNDVDLHFLFKGSNELIDTAELRSK